MKPQGPADPGHETAPWTATFIVLDVSSTITSSQWRRLVAWSSRLLGRIRRRPV